MKKEIRTLPMFYVCIFIFQTRTCTQKNGQIAKVANPAVFHFLRPSLCEHLKGDTKLVCYIPISWTKMGCLQRHSHLPSLL